MEGIKKRIQSKSYITGKVKQSYANNRYKDLLNEFLRVIGIDINHYNLINTDKKNILAKEQVLRDNESFQTYMSTINEFINTEPQDWLSDIAHHVIEVLNMVKHDFFLDLVADIIDFELIAKDFKIKDYFPIASNYQPDLLFYDTEKYYVVEIKVRRKVDLSHYYDRYKNVIEHHADVDVLNLKLKDNTIIYETYGDNCKYFYNLLNSIDQNSDLYQNIVYISQVIDRIYFLYSDFKIFREISDDNISINFDYLDKFNLEDIESLESYNEIKSQFGVYWDIMMKDLDYNVYNPKFNIDEEKIKCKEDMLNYIEKNKNNLFQEFESCINSNNYCTTRLSKDNILKKVDEKNFLKYGFQTKFKPSIYMNYGKTSNKDDRLVYYDKLFNQKLNPSKNSDYSNGVLNMLNSLFCGEYSGYLLDSRNAELKEEINLHEEYLRYRKSSPSEQSKFAKSKMKVLNVITNTEKINIYMNSVFTWSDNFNSRSKIIGYENKKEKRNDINKTKNVLRLTDYINDYKFIEKYLEELYDVNCDYKYFEKDMSFADEGIYTYHANPHQKNNLTKYYHIMHNAFKNMISLSVINNTKFRLIQTYDKSNFFIMLPNADFKDHKPIRYINVTLYEKDNTIKDSEYIKFCTLMGLMDFYCETNDHYIIVSKVISLDLTRVKILSNSLFKFMILRSYYEHIKTESNDEQNKDMAFSFLSSQFITLNTLSITDTFKNIIMVAYSGYSNLDELIDDKFNPVPKNFSQCYITYKCSIGIQDSPSQSIAIAKSKKESHQNLDDNEMIDGGFENLLLKLPVTGYVVTNAKEVFHEAFILFYIGNKGLHGSPQETLNLYSISIEFEEEYNLFLNRYKTVIQEFTNVKDYGFSFWAMYYSSKYTYSELLNNHENIRSNLTKNLHLEDSPLSVPQFSSTKSMVNSDKGEESESTFINLNFEEHKTITFDQIKKWLKRVQLNQDELIDFCERNNRVIKTINEHNKLKSIKMQNDINRDNEYGGLRHDKPYNEYRSIPELIVEGNSIKYVRMKNTYFYTNPKSDLIDCSSSKVMEEVYKDCKNKGHKTMSDFLKDINPNDNVIVRVFNKDQRTFEDREIYTSNLTGRKLLFPLEMTFKSINEEIKEEAITTPGEEKQKNMVRQRLDIHKDRSIALRSGKFKDKLYSVSSDASKWSARDMVFKFIIPILTCPFTLKEEKLHLLYCIIKYYKKFICLTDKSFFECMKFYNSSYSNDIFSKMTSQFKKNYWLVRSNWLQGNLNNTSSFVHVCAANMVKLILEWWNSQYYDSLTMRYMVHSDDSTYDFMLLWSQDTERYKNKFFENPENTGKFIIPLLKYVLKQHCIKLNEKKTYISSYFREFLSTIMVGNELTFNYLQDLLPICNDTSYVSPIDDLASYTGFLNNAFAHYCPTSIIRDVIPIINHLTSSSYNLQNTTKKNPSEGIGILSDELIWNLPVQIDAKYKLPIDVAGSLPYYTADAFNILSQFHIFLKKTKTELDELEELEKYLDVETVDRFIKEQCSQSMINYIKLCLMSQDLSLYEEDYLDSYNQKAVDQFNTSLISIKPIVKRGKLNKYLIYKEFNKDPDLYKNALKLNPEWILKKPVDHKNSELQLISNFSNDSYTNSLLFNSSELDFAKRIMDSNKNVYKFNYKEYKDEKLSIEQIYLKLVKEMKLFKFNSNELINYLYINLLNNKKYSVFVHVYFNKKFVGTKMKNTIYKVTQNRSVYTSFKLDGSNFDFISQSVLTPSQPNYKINSEANRIAIDYFNNYISSLKLEKIYQSEADIDENFEDYIKSKYSNCNSKDFLPELNQSDNEEYRVKLLNIKQRYLSICILSYKGMTSINPRTILLNYNSFILRSKVSTKIFLSVNNHSDLINYWLERIGMYSSNYLFYNYRIGKTIVVTGDDKFLIQESRSEVKLISNILCYALKHPDKSILESIFYESNLFPNYKDKLMNSKNIFDNFMYYKLQGFSDPNNVLDKFKNVNMYNYWYLKEDENNDKNFNVVYQSRGTFINFYTKNSKRDNEKILIAKRLSSNYNDNENINRILAKFKSDLRVYLNNIKFTYNREIPMNYKTVPIYIDSYKNITTRSQNGIRICNIEWLDTKSLSVYFQLDKESKSINCNFKRDVNGPTLFKFDVKDSNKRIDYSQFQNLIQLMGSNNDYSMIFKLLPYTQYKNLYEEFISEIYKNCNIDVFESLFPNHLSFQSNNRKFKMIKKFCLQNSLALSFLEQDEFINKLYKFIPIEYSNGNFEVDSNAKSLFEVACYSYADDITKEFVINKYADINQLIIEYIYKLGLSFQDSITYMIIIKMKYNGSEVDLVDEEDLLLND
ncbi:RNA dependent RNA polymerase [Emaravirus camelliae]|uniref:RNA-directed RNA polymerase L n=1 Tax=Emaravirus camelliae TaxID=2843907 RepID=A0A6B9ENA5_9VIRU|nr:RNA dependent RNA polymerase [Emaravirus camelliae]QGX73503.1 RNA dependent RNA polymerase [Emaravirus camelliae]